MNISVYVQITENTAFLQGKMMIVTGFMSLFCINNKH